MCDGAVSLASCYVRACMRARAIVGAIEGESDMAARAGARPSYLASLIIKLAERARSQLTPTLRADHFRCCRVTARNTKRYGDDDVVDDDDDSI